MLNNLHTMNKLNMIKMQEVLLLDMKNLCLSFSRDKSQKGKYKR